MRRSIALSLLSVLLTTVGATTQTEWVTLNNCQLKANHSNDGDSFHVRCKGREYIFRLYFVDAPETDERFPDRVAEQAAYFGVSKSRVIQAGEAAKQFAASKLAGSFTVITRWEDAMGRSQLPRFYALVRVNGRDLGEQLVERGLARIHGAHTQLPDGTSIANEEAKLRRLETQAKTDHRGAWASSTTDAPASVSVTNQVPADTEQAEYRISASGIRHNKNCRFFNGATTRPCGPNDGRPCKICGG